MTDDQANEERIESIRRELELKDTGDLLAIWRANDTEQWSAEAFTAVERILLERLGSLPQRTVEEPVTEALDDTQHVEEADQSLDEAEALLDEGDVEMALEICKAAIRSAPHLARAYQLQGLASSVLGQLDGAIASYTEALRLDPDLEEARENLLAAQNELYQIQRYPQAYEHLEKAIALVEKKELESALAECDLAIKAAPGYAPAHNYRGMILEKLDRVDEAIAAYRSAVQLDPEN